MIERPSFWETMTLVGPAVTLAAVPTIVSLVGGFKDFEMVGRPVSALDAFGILGTMLLPIAAWFYAQMRLEQSQARLAASWPVAHGTIKAWNVEKRYVYRNGTRYVVSVAYDYKVAGQTLAGDTYAFGPGYVTSSDMADALKDRYKPGMPVDVRYDPATPSVAVLDCSEEYATERKGKVYAVVGAALLLPLIAGFMNGWAG